MADESRRWIPLLLLLAMAGACNLDPSLAQQRTRLDREQEARMEMLHRVEARLLDARARSREWEELRTRHERVSEIACENAAEHVAEMERLQASQAEKRRRLDGSQVAQAPKLSANGAGHRHAEIPTAGN